MGTDLKYITVNVFSPYLNEYYQDAFLAMEQSSQPYNVVVVDSPGGFTWNLSVLLDCIDDSTKPTITIGSGIQMSCGAVLFTSGTPGLRIISPNSTMMIHQVSSGTSGKSSDMLNDAIDAHNATESLVYGRFDKNSGHENGFTENLIKQNMNADLNLTPQQAVDYNFADMIMSRNKAFLNLDSIFANYLANKETE